MVNRMENLEEIKERTLRNVYKEISNPKCLTFNEFAKMLDYWCKRCQESNPNVKRGDK